jgi:MFS family permease
MWGYFVYGLMESVPGLLPLLLKKYQATNTQIAFIATSLNVIGNLIFNPIVSFNSDRFRSRMGRRRPFIIYSTPLVVLFLALIPFGPDFAARLQGVEAVQRVLAAFPMAPGILLIAVFVAGFQIFDTFVASTYYYLVRDTVPEGWIGRFYGMFRLVGALPPLVFNLFVFPHAETSMKAIFVGIACFYGLGITLMCWRVKEGEFPPPEPLPGTERNALMRAWSAVRSYLDGCFSHPAYWMCFLAHAVAMFANAGGAFAVLFRRDELGINLAIQGRIAAACSVLGLSIALPCGYIADRFNCYRLVQLGLLLKGTVAVLGWFFIQDATTLFAFSMIGTIPEMVFFVALTKVLIDLFPREQYGQFGSANSAVCSLGGIVIALLFAKYADWAGNYRSYLMWMGAFAFAACILFTVVEKIARARKEGLLACASTAAPPP